MTAFDITLAIIGLALGGFLKGATGAGAPVIGVPILALVFGVPKAVAIFSVLNLLSNTWQSWSYRHAIGRGRLVWSLAIGGAVGAALGSVLLASLSTDILMGGLAIVVFFYIALPTGASELANRAGPGRCNCRTRGALGGDDAGRGRDLGANFGHISQRHAPGTH